MNQGIGGVDPLPVVPLLREVLIKYQAGALCRGWQPPQRPRRRWKKGNDEGAEMNGYSETFRLERAREQFLKP